MPDRRFVVILPIAFALSLAIGIVNLGMLFLAKDSYGAGPDAIGWLTAMWAFAYFVGCIIFRPLASRLSARASAALSNLIGAAALGAQFAYPCLASAFAANILFGLSNALAWPRVMAWLTSGLEGERLSRATGIYNVCWSVGGVVAPYLAGLLSERSPALPVYVGAGLCALNFVFLAFAGPLAPSPRSASSSSSRASGESDRSTALRFPAWIGLVAIYALYSVFANVFPLFAKDELAMSESSIGLMLLTRAAAMALGFWLFGRLAFWRFKPAFLPASIALLITVDALCAIVRSPAAILVLLIGLGFIQALGYTMSIFYGASGALDRDKRMSIHEAMLTAGQIIGSVGGGALYGGTSWRAVFAAAAGFFALCLAGQLAFLRKR
jgi:Arabinose efflux permease